MKLIGFWQEHDGDKILKDYLCEPHNPPEVFPDAKEVDMLVKYLDNGDSILSMTLGLRDGDKSIGAYHIRSDGEWIWPSHFSYYLKNGDYRFLTKEFVNHVALNSRLPGWKFNLMQIAKRYISRVFRRNSLPDRKLTQEQRIDVERYLLDILNIRRNIRR